MSTPKINFFIQAGCRGSSPGRARVRSGKRTIVRVSSPGAQFRRGAGDAAGGNQQESPGVPRCQPAAVPRSRTIVLHSPLGKSRSSKGDAAAPSSSCTPDPDVFQFRSRCPDGIITRTILRHSPDFAAGDPDLPIIPNISR